MAPGAFVEARPGFTACYGQNTARAGERARHTNDSPAHARGFERLVVYELGFQFRANHSS